jgi:outer membrane protein assembly factor BamB
MFGHDPQHTGVAGESVEPPLKLLWKYNISAVGSSPVVSGGIVYIVTPDRDRDNDYLHALDAATGAERWEWECGPYSSLLFDISSPAVYNGTVYIAHSCKEGGGYVYALDAATGVEKWKYRIDTTRSHWVYSPIAYRDTIYLCAEDCVYALDATTGAEKWKYKAGKYWSSPAVYEGRLYICDDDCVYYRCDHG